MPITTGVYGLIDKPYEIPDPDKAAAERATTLGKVAEANGLIQEQQAKAKAAQDALFDQQAIQEQFRMANGNADAAITEIEKTKPQLAWKLRTEQQNAKKLTLDNLELDQKVHKTENDTLYETLQGIDPADDETYQRVLPQLTKKFPDLAPLLPKTWSQQAKDTVLQANQTTKEYLDRRDKAQEDLATGKYVGGVGGTLSTIHDPVEWDTTYKKFQTWVPAQVMNRFSPTFSEDARKQAADLTMTPNERADNAVAQENADTSKANSQKAPAQTPRPAMVNGKLVWVVMDPSGKMVPVEGATPVPAASASAGGDDKVALREANTWRANQLAALARSLQPTVSGGSIVPVPPERKVASYREGELKRIDDSYRAMLGQPPAEEPPKLVLSPGPPNPDVVGAVPSEPRPYTGGGIIPPAPITGAIPGSPSPFNIPATPPPGAPKIGDKVGGDFVAKPAAGVPAKVHSFLSLPAQRPGVYDIKVDGVPMTFRKLADGTVVLLKK